MGTFKGLAWPQAPEHHRRLLSILTPERTSKRARVISSRRLRRWVRPSTARRSTPAPSSTRWLLVGWEEPDQWLFLRAGPRGGEPETVAVEGVSRQFDPSAVEAAGFPGIADWCCAGAGGRP